MALSAPSRIYGPGIHNSSNVNDFTTSSFSPTAGRLLVITVTTQHGDGTLSSTNGFMGVTQTLSGSWSWTVLDCLFDDNGGGNFYGRCFLAYAIVPSSPGTGTVTLNFNTGVGNLNRNRNVVIANIYEISGADPTTPVVQSVTGRNASTSSLTVNFSSGLASSSMGFAVVGNATDTTFTDIVPPTNYSELHENESADPLYNHQMCTAYDLGSAGTTVNWTGLAAVFESGTVAVEIQEESGSGPSRRVFVVS